MPKRPRQVFLTSLYRSLTYHILLRSLIELPPPFNDVAPPVVIAPPDTDADNDSDPYSVTLPEWADPAIDRRIRRFLDYTSSADTLYYITQLPPNVDWGTGPDKRVLCDTTTSEPILIWMVGTISKLYVSTSVIDPRSELTLHVAYLRDVDRDNTDKLLKATQPRPWYDGSTFVVTRGSFAQGQGPRLFSSIYDATAEFTNKANMTKIPPTELAVGDIVLVECMCYRWRRPHMRTSSEWTQWHSGFIIDSISLLARAPRSSYPEIVDTFTGSL